MVAGISCVINAKRCGRFHCHFTGPPVHFWSPGSIKLSYLTLKLSRCDGSGIFAVILGAEACWHSSQSGSYANTQCATGIIVVTFVSAHPLTSI